jgi:hypothetical protein
LMHVFLGWPIHPTNLFHQSLHQVFASYLKRRDANPTALVNPVSRAIRQDQGFS